MKQIELEKRHIEDTTLIDTLKKELVEVKQEYQKLSDLKFEEQEREMTLDEMEARVSDLEFKLSKSYKETHRLEGQNDALKQVFSILKEDKPSFLKKISKWWIKN